MKKTILLFSALILIMCGGGNNKNPLNSFSQDGHQHEAQNETGNTHEHEGEAPDHSEVADDTHQHEGESAAQEQVSESEEHEHSEIQVPPEKQKNWGIQIGIVGEQNVSSRLTLPGVVTLNENRTAHITSFVNGQIFSLSTDLGKNVKKGQTLLSINSPEYAQTQADFLQSRAKYNLSQKEFERAKNLLKEKAIEEKEYLRREADFEKLTAEYGALGSRLHSFGITHDQIEELINKCELVENEVYKGELIDPFLPIRSSISGTVIARNAIIGQHIDPTQTLFSVSDLNTLWAILDAYEKDIPFINKNSNINIIIPLYPDTFFPGKVTYIGDTIDEKLRTVKIRVEVYNQKKLLKPNMYIQGIIENSALDQELVSIPEEAVQSLEGEKIVFIPEGEDIFEVKHVQTGKKVGNQIIIISGLERGEKVVFKGAFTLKAELSKAKFGQAHVH